MLLSRANFSASCSFVKDSLMSRCVTAMVIWFSLWFVPLMSRGAERSRPNVILIMADDFGYELVGANGGTSYKTPHLDRLAQTGTRFTQCYVQPLCTPTRVQLMTGIYNVRNYIEFGTLSKDATTFGHLFRKAGDATCITGKWQLGRDFALPAHFGFDEYCLWQLTRRPERYKNAGLEVNGKEIDYSNGEYGPDIVSDYALDFVTRKKDSAFFLYYPMMLTHDPFQVTPDSDDYDSKKKPLQKEGKGARDDENSLRHQHFTDMVQYADKLIGKLVSRLEQLGLREKTLILFVGDNGTGAGMKSMMGDKVVIGGKGQTIETGMHVPLIANWPTKVASGRVSVDLVDSTDFLPTICEAAGIAVPSELKIDGRSFWAQCCGEKGRPREWIYSWYSRDGSAGTKHEFARSAQFKLYRDGRFFDVSTEDMDRKPIDVNKLKPHSDLAAAHAKLSEVLAQYQDARPKDLKNKKGKKPTDE